MTDLHPSLAARHRTVWPALTTCIAVLALATSSVVAGIPPSQAGTKTSLAATESSPWPQTNGNAAQSRVNLTEKVLTPAAMAKVGPLRGFLAPLRPRSPYCGQQAIAAPVLAGGYVYAMTNYKLSKYNAATGRLIWRINPDPAFAPGTTIHYDSLAVSGNLVIVGGDDSCATESEVSGFIFAFNASTGTLVWSANSPAEFGLAGAVVSGSYVVTAGTDLAYGVAVFNLSNGKPVWGHHDCGSNLPDLPLVVGRLVMSYGCDSQNNEIIEADNLATGAAVWSLTGSWQLQSGDLGTAAGTHLYVTDPSGTVVDLNPRTGQVEYSLSQAVNVLAVGQFRVYATCGSQGESVCAYDIGTGALKWQFGSFTTPPAFAAEATGVLYLDSGDILNSGTGQYITRIWSPATAIAVGDGRIAVVSNPRILDLYGLPGY
jgi:outer membrane protein assembly factor BamB